MAKTAAQTGPKVDFTSFAAFATPFDFEAFSKANATALKTLVDTNTRLLAATGAVNAEVADFVSRRLEKDAEVGECLVDCRSMDEAYEVYADFFQTSVADYILEMQKLFAIGEGALSGTAKALSAAAPVPAVVKTEAAE